MDEKPTLKPTSHPISIAPMVDKTNRHWRWVTRRITKHALLYTEMITAPAIVRGDRERLLSFDLSEKPLVIQLAWDEASMLAEACRIAEDYGYDEINLNCGCPSEKVQRHEFGACLMARPEKTALLVEKMIKSCNLPITVKHRIGIRSTTDNISIESYESLLHFLHTLSAVGCRKFIVHARIAILDGLNPKENREIPPLNPQFVYRLKQDMPHLFIEINGGYRTPQSIDDALKHVDAVMLGRIALDNPWMLADVDRHWFNSPSPGPSRREIIESAIPYLADCAERGSSRGLLLQGIMNLFAGRRGARLWRRVLTGLLTGHPKNFAIGLETALSMMDESILDEKPTDL